MGEDFVCLVLHKIRLCVGCVELGSMGDETEEKNILLDVLNTSQRRVSLVYFVLMSQ